MNGRYLRELARRGAAGAPRGAARAARLRDGASRSPRRRSRRSTEFWPLSGFFFDGPVDDPEGAREGARRRGARGRCWRRPREALDGVPGRGPPRRVEAALEGVVERHGVKPGKVYQPVRVALAGTTVSPGIFETVAVLGRDETLARIDATLGDG